MAKRIDTITSADVLAVLVPIWPSPSATRLRQKMSAVMRWSVAQGYRADDPAVKAVLQALPHGKQTGARKHHRAIPHSRTVGSGGGNPGQGPHARIVGRGIPEPEMRGVRA
ncbi:MAG: hypothetical protein OXF41_13140 [bacterium]|nr:hypothetical protein [bacterium]